MEKNLKLLLAVLLVASFPLTSFAAITFGNVGSDLAGGHAPSFTFNNNGEGIIFCLSASLNNVSSITFNGVAATQVGTSVAANSRFQEAWVLFNAAAGSNTVTETGNADTYMRVLAFSGAGSTANSTSNTGNSTTGSITIPSTGTNSYAIACGQTAGVGNTGGANTTIFDTTAPNFLGQGWRSTNATGGGNFTLNMSWDGTSGTWGFAGFELVPTASAVVPNPSPDDDWLTFLEGFF